MVRSVRGSNLEHCVYAHLLFIVIQWALIKDNSFFPMHCNIVKYSKQIAVSGSILQLSGSNLDAHLLFHFIVIWWTLIKVIIFQCAVIY